MTTLSQEDTTTPKKIQILKNKQIGTLIPKKLELYKYVFIITWIKSAVCAKDHSEEMAIKSLVYTRLVFMHLYKNKQQLCS